jgi:hypothetical protein
MNPPAPKDLEAWVNDNNIAMAPFAEELEISLADKSNGADDHDVPRDMPMPYSGYVTAAACWWAETKHPDAEDIDKYSFAGLLSGLSTGLYGGFGTDQYPKENQAQDIVFALAGGLAAPPGQLVGLAPVGMENRKDIAELTRTAFAFLRSFYFDDQERAVMDLISNIDQNTTARILLALARTNDSYQRLAIAAKAYLQKKAPVSSLRKAVNEAMATTTATVSGETPDR